MSLIIGLSQASTIRVEKILFFFPDNEKETPGILQGLHPFCFILHNIHWESCKDTFDFNSTCCQVIKITHLLVVTIKSTT